jgi:phage protein D/phage baseplate assembly protein gpV
MSPAAATAEQHVASYAVQVDGADVKPEIMDALGEIKIVDSLMLPDSCDLTMFVNSYEHEKAVREIDQQPFEIGKELTIKFGAIGDSGPKTVLFKGDIAAVDVDFGHGGITIGVRAYDRAYKLHRSRKIRVFKDGTVSDAVKKILSEAGFSARVTSTRDRLEWLQQDNETDWEFIQRWCRKLNYWLLVDGSKAAFVEAGEKAGRVELEYPDSLHAFHPRITGVQQLKKVTARAFDPKTKRPLSGQAQSPGQLSEAGLTRQQVSKALQGGELHISGESAFSAGELTRLSQAGLDRVANAYIEATGHVQGNPQIKAGVELQISGLGQKFSGRYFCGEVKHLIQGGGSFDTFFSTATVTPTTLAGLAGGGGNGRVQFGQQLVVGIVTNNKDPDKLGRVKVKFPALNDEAESDWLRVATMSAGNKRGMMMVPQPDEEVVVGFENGDSRRGYVLGSLFNGKDAPGDDLFQNNDGSFAVFSNKKIFEKSLDEMQIYSQKKMTVEVKDEQIITVDKDRKETVKGNMTDSVQGNFSNDAKGSGSLKATGSYTIESQASITIKAPSITVDASAALQLKGGVVDIKGSGPVNITGAIINLG